VVDVDQFERVVCDVRVNRDDGGDLLALEPHLVSGEHRLRVAGQGGHPGQVVRGQILAGQHGNDAVECGGGAGVDRRDPGVRNRAAQDGHVQHAGQHDVVDIAAGAAEEPLVFDSANRVADPADLSWTQRGRFGDVCGHTCAPLAADLIALTMLT